MLPFTFCTPTRYVFGPGVESQVGKLALEYLHASRVLLVYGGGSAVRSGLIDRVKLCLQQASIGIVEISGIKPNPTDDRVYEGIALCRDCAVDAIIAVGGGSVIDTAKAIAAGVPYDGDFWDFFCGRAVPSRALPIGVVLTIPAAGSEGSGNSVITRIADARKISIRTDMVLRPKFALLNPELTFTLPPYQTASGIADMMAHILERYFTPTPDVEVTDRISEGLLMAIINEAPKVIENPCDYQVRANIMWSGTLAHNGICGCGRLEDWSSHGLEHELSALYGVTHGAGLAVVFPAWIHFMADVAPAKPAQLGRRIFSIDPQGILSDTEVAHATADALRAFFVSIGLPATLTQLGIDNPDFDTLVTRFHENKGTPAGNYHPLTPSDTLSIYRLML